jgi:dienelactone hydrolase
VIYPGATHAFDSVRNTTEMLGHILEYDPGATEDAEAKVRALLAEYATR